MHAEPINCPLACALNAYFPHISTAQQKYVLVYVRQSYRWPAATVRRTAQLKALLLAGRGPLIVSESDNIIALYSGHYDTCAQRMHYRAGVGTRDALGCLTSAQRCVVFDALCLVVDRTIRRH